jgi:hypothetical protein
MWEENEVTNENLYVSINILSEHAVVENNTDKSSGEWFEFQF